MSGNVQGKLYLAKNPHALLPLPAELEQAVESETAWQRRGGVNDANGIPGISVTLDEANQHDEGDPSTDAVNHSTDALLTARVDAIIGPWKSAAALKLIDKVACSGVIMFAPSTTSPVFTTYPDHGFYFRTAPTNVREGAQLYDAVVITALAAAVAGTDEPSAIAEEINGVTKTGEKCTSFASCMTLVKDRKDIDYEGASGPLEFTDPGEPGSVTYVTNEIQTDGTVKPLSSERAGS